MPQPQNMTSVATQRENVVDLSIVAPMFNESPVVEAFYQRLIRAVNPLQCNYEIVCVDDGSRDNTYEKLYALSLQDTRIKVIGLSRNFGKEIALTAGLDFCRGRMVIPIDADLQDPPEMIPAMIKKAEEGFDVVYAVRTRREGESWLKTFTSSAFYKVLRQMTDTPIPANTGDFRLMRQPVVEAIKQMRETHRFMRGIFSWVGFKQAGLPYVRETRFAGKTKWNYWKLWNFAIEGITSFSHMPLKVATYLGLLAASFAFVAGIFYAVKAILWGDPVPGFPTLITAILFMGGIQLITLGVIGEYVGRIYGESKGRPLYFVARSNNLGASSLTTAPEPQLASEVFSRNNG